MRGVVGVLLMLVVSCGQQRQVALEENPPKLIRVQVAAPPDKEILGVPAESVQVEAKLDLEEAGSATYWLEVKWSTPAKWNSAAWGFHYHQGTLQKFPFVLDTGQVTKGGRKGFYPYRLELPAGQKHTLQFRAVVFPRPGAAHPEQMCPRRPDQCPLLRTIVVDLTGF